MQPLSQSTPAPNAASHNNAAPTTANGAGAEQGNSGVVLRWRTSARVQDGSASNAQSHTNSNAPSTGTGSLRSHATSGTTASTSTSLAARAYDANTMRDSNANAGPARSGVTSPSYAANATVASHTAPAGNPLRSSTNTNNVVSNHVRPDAHAAATFVPRGTSTGSRSAVQQANFQAPAGGNAQAAPAPRGGNGGNSLLDNNVAPPSFPGANNGPGLQAPPALQAQPPANFPPVTPPVTPPDALTLPEDAPAPPVVPVEPKEEFSTNTRSECSADSGPGRRCSHAWYRQ